MCLSAIMWLNINVVYYGNTKEDAGKIGFRDRYIYDAISKLYHDKDVSLELICIDKKETKKTFSDFVDKKDKTIY